MGTREQRKRWDMKWRKKNPDKLKAGARIRQRRLAERWHKWFIEKGYLIPSKTHLYHHPDPTTKCFEIGTWITKHGINTKNITLMEIELEKCEYITKGRHNTLHKGGD